MDSTTSQISRQACLEIVTGMINHRGEVEASGLPARGYGQGFEGAAARAPFDGMPLDLPHAGHGHMRTLRELALRPAKLADTVTDSPSDRSPVLWIAFRHAFLRAPLPAPRVADSSAIPRPTETNRDQTTSIRNNYQAETSGNPMISALVMATRSCAILAGGTREQ
jgi:hypothetical protein